ncbi:nitrate reductase molybdenum cofactor assembly chaperone [Gordonia sp. NPDC003376]
MRLRMRRPLTTTDHRVVHQVASWCLGYPDDALLARLPLLDAALVERDDTETTDLLRGMVRHLAQTPPAVLRHDYIELFDLNRKHTLYLTYWTDGDTRRRGESLAAIKQLYRDSGFVVDLHGELPDHLPIILEFCAIADPERGTELLRTHRRALESIRQALTERGSRHADVLTAICSTLPAGEGAGIGVRTEIPIEAVGLETFR